MDVPILSGIKTDSVGDFRTVLPRNYIPVPKAQGISQGYLRPADGIAAFGTGPGPDRGGIRWNDGCYRISGSKLISINAGGSVTVLGEVGNGGPVKMDYSFDRLAIASNLLLYYWNGSTLVQVTDPDLGPVLDVVWIGGYFICTDGTSLVQTDLTDPTSVNPLHYGSAEADPDSIKAVDRINLELFALNRFTIEAYENVGGTGFAFQRIDSAMVSRGVLGTHTYCKALDTFFFLGGGRSESGVEPPSVYVMSPGSSQPIATREVDTILQGYSEAELAAVVMEARTEKSHVRILLHLPDQTLVYDLSASKTLGTPVWATLDSGVQQPAQYRARGLVWCYDRWIAGDPTSSAIGTLTLETMEHHGSVIGWEWGTLALYADGNDGIVHEIELVGLPGHADFGKDPVIWTSYSHDGETWSQEKAIHCGKAGERQKRMMWRGQGAIRHYRMQKFRGTSDARVTFAKLRMSIEPLQTGLAYG